MDGQIIPNINEGKKGVGFNTRSYTNNTHNMHPPTNTGSILKNLNRYDDVYNLPVNEKYGNLQSLQHSSKQYYNEDQYSRWK